MQDRNTPASESDVAADREVVRSRNTGGDPDEDRGDAQSTTGTGDNETFVGQVSGDDAGYAEETGAEARSND